jgi:hypothetical protein
MRRILTPLVALLMLVTLLPLGSLAQVNPEDMVSGTLRTSNNPGTHNFTLFSVPAESRFVLTDVHFTFILLTSTTTTTAIWTLREDTTDRWVGRFLQSITPVVLNWPLIQDFTTGLVFEPGTNVNLRLELGGNNTTGWAVSWSGYLVPTSSASAEDDLGTAPGLALGSNPNPAGRETTLTFKLSTPSDVVLAVFDVQGRRIRRIHEGRLPAGLHSMIWDGENDLGVPVSDGVYLARLMTDEGSSMSKITRRP